MRPPLLEGEPDTGGHPRPNIVVLITDDQPYNMLGVAGNTVIRTPQLDAIANEGTYFSRMYLTLGECSASRATLWTGRLPHATGILKNGQQIDLDQPLLPRILHDDGYQTAMIGKCHLQGDPFYEDSDAEEDAKPVNPDPFTRELGFDHRVLFYPDKGSISDFYNYELVRNGQPEEIRDEYVTDKLTDEAISFIDDRTTDSDPFFLWVAYNVPHEPLADRNRPPEFHPDHGGTPGYAVDDLPLPPSLTDDLSGKPPQLVDSRPHQRFLGSNLKTARRYLRNAYEMIENLDTNAGRIFDALDERGLADDTVFIFLSDNGQFFGEHQMMYKGSTFYEEQMRTPLIVRYPRLAPPGLVVDEVTTSLDFMPTLLDLARIPIPADVMGASLVSALSGTGGPDCESAYMEYEGWRSWVFPMRGVVWNDFKFIHHMGHGPYGDYGFELYDLAADPYEMNNLLRPRGDGRSPLFDFPQDARLGPALMTLRREMALWQSRMQDPEALEIYQSEISTSGGSIRVVVDTELPSQIEIDIRPSRCATCQFITYGLQGADLVHAVEINELDLTTLWDVRVFVLGDNGHGNVVEALVNPTVDDTAYTLRPPAPSG